MSRFAVAGVVLDQEQEVEGLAVEVRVAILHAARGQVGLQANDRLDPLADCQAVEVNGAVQGAVIRKGNGGHAQLLGALDELRQAAEAVQKGVLRVHMEVNERLVVLRQGHITFFHRIAREGIFHAGRRRPAAYYRQQAGHYSY